MCLKTSPPPPSFSCFILLRNDLKIFLYFWSSSPACRSPAYRALDELGGYIGEDVMEAVLLIVTYVGLVATTRNVTDLYALAEKNVRVVFNVKK